MEQRQHGPASRSHGTPYAAVLLAVWMVYWLAFFPGIVSYDAVSQWGQIVAGHYDDWHPVFHTWTLWLLTRLGHTFGTVSLAQVVLTAFLVGQLLATIRRLGAPAWLVWSTVGWLALSPAFGVGVIAVWKDNAFGLALLWTLLLLLRVVEGGVLTPAVSLALGVALALMSLFRHNGPLIALPTLATVALYLSPRGRREILTSATVAVVVVATVIGITRTAHIPHAPPLLKQQELIHQVGGLLSAGTPISAQDRAILETLAPLPVWTRQYDCRWVRPFLYSPALRQGLNLHRWVLLRVWLHLAARNPGALAYHWLCVTRYLWAPQSALVVGPLVPDGRTVAQNPYGVREASWLPGLEVHLKQLLVGTLQPGSIFRILIWQPAVYLYVVLASLALALTRTRSVTPIIVLSPALWNTGVWLVMSAGPHFRFQWPVVLTAPIAVCVSMTGPPLSEVMRRVRVAPLEPEA